jgi:predicted DNA-binding transcriptional regulator YafY
MDTSQACEALRSKCRLELKYSGRDRIVEVHAVGYTKEERPIMRAWQVRGGSASGDSSGWKLFRLDEIESAKTLQEISEAPRSGYHRGDPMISRIVCEL